MDNWLVSPINSHEFQKRLAAFENFATHWDMNIFLCPLPILFILSVSMVDRGRWCLSLPKKISPSQVIFLGVFFLTVGLLKERLTSVHQSFQYSAYYIFTEDSPPIFWVQHIGKYKRYWAAASIRNFWKKTILEKIKKLLFPKPQVNTSDMSH